MNGLLRFLPTLRGAAAIGLLSWAAAAGAETVGVSATGSTGVAGGDAFVEIVYAFDGPYPLLALDLTVSWNSSVLSWDAANTTVTWAGDTTQIDTLVAALDTVFGSVLLTPQMGGFAVSVLPFVAPALQGEVRLHIAFDIDANAPAGASVVQFSGIVANDNTGDEESYRTAATIGIRNDGTGVPLPGSASLMAAAALAALAARRRRPRSLASRSIPSPLPAA